MVNDPHSKHATPGSGLGHAIQDNGQKVQIEPKQANLVLAGKDLLEDLVQVLQRAPEHNLLRGGVDQQVVET